MQTFTFYSAVLKIQESDSRRQDKRANVDSILITIKAMANINRWCCLEIRCKEKT